MNSTVQIYQGFKGATGLPIAADLRGPPDGHPVLLMHGSGQTRGSWRKALDASARAGYRTIAVDARGHGESAWDPDGNYSNADMVADACALIDQLGGRIALVGASMGGLAALGAAARCPEAVKALVMVDVTPSLNPEGVARVAGFMTSAPNGFATLDEAADAIANYLPHRKRPSNPAGLARNMVQRADGNWHWHWDPKLVTQPRGALEQRKAQLIGYARAVKAPTLLLRGANSELVDPEALAELQALIPHAETAEMAGAHHMVAGDDNDAFSRSVLSFLKKVYPA